MGSTETGQYYATCEYCHKCDSFIYLSPGMGYLLIHYTTSGSKLVSSLTKEAVLQKPVSNCRCFYRKSDMSIKYLTTVPVVINYNGCYAALCNILVTSKKREMIMFCSLLSFCHFSLRLSLAWIFQE